MTRERRPSASWFALTALALPLGAMAQSTPLGSELQVNTFTTSAQSFPFVAADPDGDFVVAWDSLSQDGDNFGVFARRFSSAGAALASEFQISTRTIQGQRLPTVATDADGDFVVVWRGNQQDDPSYYGIFGRRFSSAGDALAAEFQVNTYTPNEQLNPAVAAGSDGDFVVVWFSKGQDGASAGVFGQRFTSAGATLASEFQVNTYTTEYQRNPAVVTRTGGDFVVVWQSNLQDGSSWGVFGRRFSSTGVAVAGEFQVNSYTSNYQGAPSVALDAEGDFVVAWQSLAQDGAAYGVFAQRFSSAGAPVASEFHVSAYTTGNDRNPSVVATASGDFVVAWHDSGVKDVFARRFSSAGVPLTGDFMVNTYQTNYQYFPSVASSASGDFVVAWQSAGQDGNSYGIFAQRFAGLATLDIDGNGTTEPLTDGLLVLRRLFSFSGANLTTNAVDLVHCTRCDAAAIQAYIAGLGLVLDIDGNDALDPLTDGLLTLRFLFSFTGTNLTTGATADDCSRCDAAMIQPYLVGLTT
jgi:hypothetical protein